MTRQRARKRLSNQNPAPEPSIRHGRGNPTAQNQRWRQMDRPHALRRIASRTADLTWSPTLLRPLLEELYVDDTFEELVGPLERIPLRRYPHAVAIALVLRHSWRPDDLRQFVRQLGIKVRT